MSFKQLKLRGDTAANWTTNDPTLAEREIGIETDTLLFKIGDGATAWTSLAYAAITPANISGTANEINVADDGSGGVTIGIVDPLIVSKGGTGVATLTDHSVLLGSGTDAITSLGVATDGQLVIGSTGIDPVLATLTGTADQVSVTNGAGSITLSTPQDIDTAADMQLNTVQLDAATWQIVDRLNLDDTNFNTFLGTDVFANDPGQYNVGMGSQAGYNNDASGAGIQGDYNLYLGYRAGYGQTAATTNTGYLNVAIGGDALLKNTSGYRNLAIGNQALSQNTVGYRNVALGNLSMYNNTSGRDCIAIGQEALFTNLTGYTNTAIGAYALYKHTGMQTVAIGGNSFYNSTGNYGTAIGVYSGFSLTTGASNLFLGYKSGYNQTTNSNLLIIDNQDRGSAANEAIESLIYGVFSDTVADQALTINGDTYIGNATTGQDLRIYGNIVIADSGTIGSASDTDAITIDSSGNVGINCTPACKLDSDSTIRAQGYSVPSGGAGIEIGYVGDIGYVSAYNRTGSTYQPLVLRGSEVSLFLGGTEKVEVASGGVTVKDALIIQDNGANFKLEGQAAVTVAIGVFASNTTNKGVAFQFVPNGTATDSYFQMCNDSDRSNYSFCDYNVIGANAAISPRDIGSPGTSVANLLIGGSGDHSAWTTVKIDATNTYIGDGGSTNYIQIGSNGDVSFTGTAGFYPRILNQSAEPAAGTGATQCDTGEMVVWTDTDDSKCYLCYNHGGTVKTVEMI